VSHGLTENDVVRALGKYVWEGGLKFWRGVALPEFTLPNGNGRIDLALTRTFDAEKTLPFGEPVGHYSSHFDNPPPGVKRYEGLVFIKAEVGEPEYVPPDQLLFIEAKVRRATYRADKKWESYLPWCTHFAFAGPSKLIELIAEEVPEWVGLFKVDPITSPPVDDSYHYVAQRAVKTGRARLPKLNPHADPEKVAAAIRDVGLRAAQRWEPYPMSRCWLAAGDSPFEPSTRRLYPTKVSTPGGVL
jgi:hypothetical protein